MRKFYHNHFNHHLHFRMLSFFKQCFQAIISYITALFSSKIIKFNNFSVVLEEECVLGEGAFSVVYKAKEHLPKVSARHFAIKKMFIQTKEFEKTVMNEIDSFSRFKHENILNIVDAITHLKDTSTGTRVAYLLFPFVRRGSLRTVLNKRLHNSGNGDPDSIKPNLRNILSDFHAICGAFNVLHTHSPSYIHQDVKPENILIADSGAPLLTDFGSVRLADVVISNRSQALAIADEASEKCTVSYRSPELFDPPRSAVLDCRTDVWSMGCLLFAWWFGYSPFECEFSVDGSVKVVECSHLRVLANIPKPNKPTREDLEILTIVEWMLHRDFSTRPFTSDVLELLSEHLVKLPSANSFDVC